MATPDFLAQSAETRTDAERRRWFVDRSDEAYAAGCKMVRISYHPDNPYLLLCEGWKDRHVDQGPISWQLEVC